ncbi:hypothetical protein D3C85_1377130 [compost metagenome]
MIAVRNLNFCFSAPRFCSFRSDCRYPFNKHRLIFLSKIADGPQHLYLFRNNIRPYPTVNRTNGHHSRILRHIQVPTHNGLQVIHNLCRDYHRIHTAPGISSMCLSAGNGDFQIIYRRHYSTRTISNVTYRSL